MQFLSGGRGRWCWGLVLCFLAGCGNEPYREHGRAITRESTQFLIEQRFCKGPDECEKKGDIFGGHGRQVRFTVYSPIDRRVLSGYIAYIAVNGIAITKTVPMSSGALITEGVPISVKVYPKSREDYGNLLLARHNPIIDMKVHNEPDHSNPR